MFNGLCVQGLWKFEELHGRAPAPNSDEDAEEVTPPDTASHI